MLHALLKRINSQELLNISKYQYTEKVLLSDVVPAGQSKLGKTNISSLGDFLCQYITGDYQTAKLDTGSGHYVDDGINHLRGQLADGNGQRKLFNDYVPFDLFLSPGRQKFTSATINGAAPQNITNNLVDDAGVATLAAPSQSLFYPLEFEYLFPANADILLDVKNDSSVDLAYNICFHGIIILSSTSVYGINNQ